MQYVIDTNIVFGIINRADRLNPHSEQLIKCLSGKLIILGSVAFEVRQKFPKKVYDAILPVLKFYRSIIMLKHIPEPELRRREMEELEKLIKTHPKMENFYKLAFEIARKAREEYGIEGVIFGLMDYYTEISDCNRLIEIFKNRVKNINQELDLVVLSIRRMNEINKFFDKLELIKERIIDIRFKNDSDRRIFYDFVLNFEGKIAIFISDDEEFVKKANKALDYLRGYLNVENLIFKRLNEFLESC